jgi:predicted Zn finger-like uncharacterized protein
MNVTCPECSSVFRVDPAKIPLAGVRARCSVCGGVIAIGERGRIDDDFTASAPMPQSAATPPRQRPSVSAPLPPRPPVSMPTPPQPMHAGFASQAGAPAQQPRTSAETSMPSRPSAVTPPSDRAPVSAPSRETPPRAPAVPPAQAAGAPPAAPPGAPPAAPRMSPFAPPSSPQPSMPSAPAPAPAAAQPAPPPQSAPPPLTSARPGAPQPGAPVARPPINPFLANDPNQKAKRLARALVSDIIAYFPDRHAQGKREGTLRESFREEIKKSYEEYVEQMGKEFAENTTHFQDALNDVLAGGAKIF